MNNFQRSSPIIIYYTHRRFIRSHRSCWRPILVIYLHVRKGAKLLWIWLSKNTDVDRSPRWPKCFLVKFNEGVVEKRASPVPSPVTFKFSRCALNIINFQFFHFPFFFFCSFCSLLSFFDVYLYTVYNKFREVFMFQFVLRFFCFLHRSYRVLKFLTLSVDEKRRKTF